MLLDKSTLQAELALLAQNATALDNAIIQKTKTVEDLTVDLERARGARQYHDLVAQQIQNALNEVLAAEKPSVAPAT